MKKILLSLNFALLVVFVSCNVKQNNSNTKETDESSTLYIQTVTATGTDSSQIKKKITSVTSDYFEVSLDEIADKPGYIANKTITEPTSMENYKFEFLTIVNKVGEQLTFKTSTDFLNFMSAREYEMVDQTKKQYGTNYTFKKK